MASETFITEDPRDIQDGDFVLLVEQQYRSPQDTEGTTVELSFTVDFVEEPKDGKYGQTIRCHPEGWEDGMYTVLSTSADAVYEITRHTS